MKKKTIMAIVSCLSLGAVFFWCFFDSEQGASPFIVQRDQIVDEAGTSASSSSNEELAEAIRLDVPLENQFDEVALGNGCEVTALSMLLNYYAIDTDKNTLASILNYVPVYEEGSYRGDPREGFVGNIYGGDAAMGVDVEPIAEVAKQVVPEDVQVVSGRDRSFSELLTVLASGTPIWMIATLELQVPTNDDFFRWETQNGPIYVTALIHSVVITGIDEETMYVNDPYGYKDRAVSKTDLAEIYEKMGQQYLYLQK